MFKKNEKKKLNANRSIKLFWKNEEKKETYHDVKVGRSFAASTCDRLKNREDSLVLSQRGIFAEDL